MDINFHYFTVKTLARYAGFPESEAQRIAEFSEYIDDFNWITCLDCKNIPPFIKDDPDCDLYMGSILTLNFNFNPAMTGFSSYIDLLFLTAKRTQRFTVSPFHFIPRRVDSISDHSRTTPAIVGDGSLISDMLTKARNSLQNETEDRMICLKRIGMYLHTFADTYAHQLFSGYRSWANDVEISNVIDNGAKKDITNAVMQSVRERNKQGAENGIIPMIGHALAGHTPDLTNVSFTMKYKRDENDNERSLVHTRSNTSEFLIAARNILNYLRSCRGEGNVTEGDWEALADKIRSVFLISYNENTKIQTFIKNWKGKFPEIEYDFNKADIEARFYEPNSNSNSMVDNQDPNSFLGNNYSAEFYEYNYIADKVLVKMYGSKPRSGWWD